MFKPFQLAVWVLALAPSAYGNTFIFGTASNAVNPTDNNPVSVQAIVTTSLNTITVELDDLLVDPGAISQVLSNFTFTMGAPATYNGLSLVLGSTGQLIDKTWPASNQPVADTTDSITNWKVSSGDTATTATSTGTSLSTLTLSSIIGGTSDLIIGNPGANNIYNNANNSIKNCHACPFILKFATFSISLTGVTSSTQITTPKFGFGTAIGTETVGGITAVPEPSTMVMVGGVLLGLLTKGGRKRFKTARAAGKSFFAQMR